MQEHKGMRPQDVVILLKIVSKGPQAWYMKDLAQELSISGSEVSESINRSVFAGLIQSDKKTIQKQALLDFLLHGLKYVYPVQPGAMVRGMRTSHSTPPLSDRIQSSEHYVWPWAKGSIRGQEIQPLHPSVPEACSKDVILHQLLALVDARRVGRMREQNLAENELRNRIESYGFD